MYFPPPHFLVGCQKNPLLLPLARAELTETQVGWLPLLLTYAGQEGFATATTSCSVRQRWRHQVIYGRYPSTIGYPKKQVMPKNVLQPKRIFSKKILSKFEQLLLVFNFFVLGRKTRDIEWRKCCSLSKHGRPRMALTLLPPLYSKATRWLPVLWTEGGTGRTLWSSCRRKRKK